MCSMEPRMKIIGGIAEAAGAHLTRSELAAIPSLFDQHAAKGGEYEDTSSLIKKTLDLYAEIDEPTADSIFAAFTNRPVETPLCDDASPSPASVFEAPACTWGRGTVLCFEARRMLASPRQMP